MLPCNKRQTVVKRSESLTILRCLNRQSGVHGQEVDEGVCSRCPVRSVHHKRPCRGAIPKTPAEMDHGPEVTPQEMFDVTDEEVMEMIESAGLDSTDMDKAQAELASDVPAGYPPLSMQLWTYKEALIRWHKAGRPTRSQEEVEELHKKCEVCEWYDKEKSRCKGCGCKVTVGSVAILNKLKMTTEHCPKGEF